MSNLGWHVCGQKLNPSSTVIVQQIECVATALIEHQTLEGARIDEIVRGSGAYVAERIDSKNVDHKEQYLRANAWYYRTVK
jgi:hypothetical protein